MEDMENGETIWQQAVAKLVNGLLVELVIYWEEETTPAYGHPLMREIGTLISGKG